MANLTERFVNPTFGPGSDAPAAQIPGPKPMAKLADLTNGLKSPVRSLMQSWKPNRFGRGGAEENPGSEGKVAKLEAQLAQRQNALEAALYDLEDSAARELKLKEEICALQQREQSLAHNDMAQRDAIEKIRDSNKQLAHAGMAEAQLNDQTKLQAQATIAKGQDRVESAERQMNRAQSKLKALQGEFQRQKTDMADSVAAKKLVQFELGTNADCLRDAREEIRELRSERDRMMLKAAGAVQSQMQLTELRDLLHSSSDLLDDVSEKSLEGSLVPIVQQLLVVSRDQLRQQDQLECECRYLQTELQQAQEDNQTNSLLGSRLASVELKARDHAMRAAKERDHCEAKIEAETLARAGISLVMRERLEKSEAESARWKLKVPWHAHADCAEVVGGTGG